MALEQFNFTEGGNKFSDIKSYINNSIVRDSSIASAITGSQVVSGSTNVTGSINLTGSLNITGSITGSVTGSLSLTGSLVTNWLTLTPIIGTLPSSSATGPAPATGSLFISGSGTTYKLYLWNGTQYFTASMNAI